MIGVLNRPSNDVSVADAGVYICEARDFQNSQSLGSVNITVTVLGELLSYSTF